MTVDPNRDLPPSAFGPARSDSRTVAVWSSQRPRPTIDLTPERSRAATLKAYLPHVAILSLALIVGAGAATFATAPSMTDGLDDTAGLSAIDAREMGLALNLDPSGEQKRQAAIGRDVGALKTEITRLQRALNQSKATQTALSKSAVGQEEVKNLKLEIAALQKTLETTRDAAAAKIDTLTARIEKPSEDAARVAELQARLDKIETADAARASQNVIAKPAAPDPETTGSIAAPDAGGQVVRNWTVREVYDGVALLDGRNGLIEVMRGAIVPGLGRIKAIERRDRQWVVLTDRGVILQKL